MRKLIIILLVILFLLVAALLAFGVYIYFFLQSIMMDEPSGTQQNNNVNPDSPSVENSQDIEHDKNPLLSSQQEQLLEKVGVDPAKLPYEITPEMEACFTEKLGTARVEEIKKGAEPNAFDFFKAQSCIKTN